MRRLHRHQSTTAPPIMLEGESPESYYERLLHPSFTHLYKGRNYGNNLTRANGIDANNGRRVSVFAWRKKDTAEQRVLAMVKVLSPFNGRTLGSMTLLDIDNDEIRSVNTSLGAAPSIVQKGPHEHQEPSLITDLTADLLAVQGLVYVNAVLPKTA